MAVEKAVALVNCLSGMRIGSSTKLYNSCHTINISAAFSKNDLTSCGTLLYSVLMSANEYHKKEFILSYGCKGIMFCSIIL